jgi:hypothetical protein
MALFDSLATKTLDALPRARSNAETARQRLQAHDASKPSGEDAEVSYLWKRDRTEMVLKLEAADEAVKFHERKAAAAEKELAERAAAAEVRLIEKAAISDEKLIREAEALSIKLAAKLGEIEASRRRRNVFARRRQSRFRPSTAMKRFGSTGPGISPRTTASSRVTSCLPITAIIARLPVKPRRCARTGSRRRCPRAWPMPSSSSICRANRFGLLNNENGGKPHQAPRRRILASLSTNNPPAHQSRHQESP